MPRFALVKFYPVLGTRSAVHRRVFTCFHAKSLCTPVPLVCFCSFWLPSFAQVNHHAFNMEMVDIFGKRPIDELVAARRRPRSPTGLALREQMIATRREELVSGLLEKRKALEAADTEMRQAATLAAAVEACLHYDRDSWDMVKTASQPKYVSLCGFFCSSFFSSSNVLDLLLLPPRKQPCVVSATRKSFLFRASFDAFSPE